MRSLYYVKPFHIFEYVCGLLHKTEKGYVVHLVLFFVLCGTCEEVRSHPALLYSVESGLKRSPQISFILFYDDYGSTHLR